MKRATLFLVVGFLLASAFWIGLYKYMWRPRDYSVDVPTVTAVGERMSNDLKRATCMKFGSVSVLVPTAERPFLLAQVKMADDPESPTIVLSDDDTDGRLDSICIFDSAGHNFELTDTDNDAIWDYYTYSPAQNVESPAYSDRNMDGIPDIRVSLETMKRSIPMGLTWYDLVREGDKCYVKIKGANKEVVSNDGIWILKGE